MNADDVTGHRTSQPWLVASCSQTDAEQWLKFSERM